MMAPRKDMMRIIRRDAGFSATLGFGEDAGATSGSSVLPMMEQGAAPAPEQAGATLDGSAEIESLLQDKQRAIPHPVNRDETAAPRALTRTPCNPSDGTMSSARGTVVYVAVSLTARQAALAEIWAKAARGTVPFLIRHVAQSLRDQVCDDWEKAGMPEVEEPRGIRGKYPTSVTLTLRPQFAAELAARHDPLGMLGLGRAMGPAFRARFQEAFDLALAKAEIQMVNERDEQ